MNKRMKGIWTALSGGGLGLLMLGLLLCASNTPASADIAQQIDDPAVQDALPVVLFQDRFDGGSLAVSRAVAADGDYGWGRVESGEWADTFWCAQDGAPALIAGTHFYSSNMSTTVTYGPIDMRVTTATLEFSHWISVASGDGLEWGYSLDGSTFTYSPVSTAQMGQWQTMTVGLNPLLGRSAVYLAFRFQSDAASEDLGVFLDNVIVRTDEQGVTARIGIAPDLGTTVCRHAPTTFSDISLITGTLSARRWLFGDDSSTSDAALVVHTFTAAPGPFAVNLWVTTTAGLTSNANVSLTVVDPPPTPAIQMSTSQTWTGVVVVFTDIGSGSADSRRWDFGDGTVITGTEASVSHVYSAAGPKTITLTRISAAGCTSSAQTTLAVSGKTYMPVVFKNKFYGYEKTDNFTNWSSGWPAGGKRTLNPDGSVAEEYNFGYKVDNTFGSLHNWTGSDPVTLGGLYHIWVRDNGDHVFLTGPESMAVQQNFTYAASLRRRTTGVMDGDEYGILISSKPIDAINQQSDLVYTFHVRLFVSSQKRQAVVKKWKIVSHGIHQVTYERSFEPNNYLAWEQNFWNRFYIIRQGNTLTFCTQNEGTWGKWNEGCVHALTDDSLPDKLYIGFYAAHYREYSYDMEYQFDDVYIKATAR